MNNYENQNMNHDVNNTAKTMDNAMNSSVNTVNNQTNSSDLPMRWYKFLIRFGLYASFVLNFLGSFFYFLAGFSKGIVSGYLYGYYVSDSELLLFACDVLMGATMLVMALVALSARFALMQYKKIAPTLLLTLYKIQVVALLLYPLTMFMISEDIVFNLTTVIQVISAIVALVGNHFYFVKRKSLFTNN